MSKQTVSVELDGLNYSIETGRFAKFANGAVMVRCGDTMVLVTVVAEDVAKPDYDYLPLQVEYREKIASAGKFPGGFLKREGRPSDREVLTSRLIDRPIRPLLPKSWRFDTQVLATVFSCDLDVDPDTIASVGASAALMISDIPYKGPISEVRVGRIAGEFVLNPSHQLLKTSDIDITVAGTDTSIVMVEGECNEISEEVFLAALEFAHERIKILNNLQHQLAELAAVPKREFIEREISEEFSGIIKETIYDELKDYVYSVTSKAERSQLRNSMKEKVIGKVTEVFSEREDFAGLDLALDAEEVLSKLEKKEMRKMILEKGIRLDGRGLRDIRPISCEVGILPRTHGSALFTRGETQSLSTVTLGTKHDQQMVDGLQPTYTNRFMLHYNFPPFCTGEVGRLGTGRREIGHGNLAERAIKAMLPYQEEFSYTIRVVSDILESNGSSSMATVCAGSLALFNAGVPMRKPVSGIAMGLIKEEENTAILSDILGDEDFLGDMDFKVAGTADGITACQMDIKIEGMPLEIMKAALEQAKEGRLHILSIMNECIEEPNEDMSPYAPRFTTIQIPQESIGAVIGSGGETIRSIVADTGADIDIEEDGKVTIAATSQDASDRAISIIQSILRKPEEGETYSGKVKEIREGMGAFIEFMPKRQGLLHISQIAHERIENIAAIMKVGDVFDVKLLEITRDGKFRLSRKALLPRPVGMNNDDDYDNHRSSRPPSRDSRRPERRDDRRDDRRPRRY